MLKLNDDLKCEKVDLFYISKISGEVRLYDLKKELRKILLLL